MDTVSGMVTISDKIQELSVKQRAVIEAARLARERRDAGAKEYGAAIVDARDAGLTFGVLARELEVAKETLWRLDRRYRKD